MMKTAKELDPSILLNDSKPGFFGSLFAKVKDPIETFALKQKTVAESIKGMEAQREAFALSAAQAAQSFRGIREELEQSLATQAKQQKAMLEGVEASTRKVLEDANQTFMAQAETLVLSQPCADLSPLQAVIFDWAGTLVDFGSLAPTQIFVEAFASFGITITLAQARGPMGLSKWDHIHQLLQDESIAAQWQTVFGRTPTNEDVDAIYARFMPLQIAKVGEFSAPIAGAVQTLQWLRAHGLKVGSCSGPFANWPQALYSMPRAPSRATQLG